MVEGGGGLYCVADDGERGVVCVTGASDERVGEGVARVGVDRGERADGGTGDSILSDRGHQEGYVGRRVITRLDRDDAIDRIGRGIGWSRIQNRFVGVRIK